MPELQPELPEEATLAAAGVRLELSAATDTAAQGVLATVTLNKPERKNSQTPRMWAALQGIGAGLPEATRVVVLKGAGPCFSAGLDVGLISPQGIEGEESVFELMHGSDDEVLGAIDRYQQGFTWLADPRFISIAQVHSFAIGGGFQMALACDLRVVSDDVRFCMKEPALGLVPDLAGTKPLVEAVGYQRALEMCATARYVGAAEAVEIGLALTAVPTEELDDTVADLVAALIAHPAGAVRETTALLRSASARTLEEQRLLERQAQVRRFRALVNPR